MYLPAEDSIFFSEFLENYFLKLPDKKISYLDMGCGSGILSEAAKQAKIKKILAVDIDNESVEFVKKKGTPVKISNLFSNLKDENFDIITFNAPYLPEDKHDFQKDTTGGKNGDEASIKFLKQAKKHLNKNGKIFLLVSSFTPLDKINKFNPKIVAKKKLFFEELLILEII